jgi:hypothetical protein
MVSVALRARVRKGGFSLPLFDWADENERLGKPAAQNVPRPISIIARRFGVPPATAALLAFHAGFNLEVGQ